MVRCICCKRKILTRKDKIVSWFVVSFLMGFAIWGAITAVAVIKICSERVC